MRLVVNNNEELFNKDMEDGTGFIISNPEGLTKDKKRTIDGIYSTLYGSDHSDKDAEYDMYTCNCGELKGRFYEGVVCSTCNTEVKLNDNDISKTGWMVLESYYIINPLMFHHLSRIFGPKELNSILKYNKEIDKDGNIVTIVDENMNASNPNHGIGMIEFYERFDELLELYSKKLDKDKQENLKMILENRDSVFIKHIPVFSLILRPIVIIKDNMIFAEINKMYATLITNVYSLNKNNSSIDRKLVKVLPNLYNTQLLLNDIHNVIIKMVGGKSGHIRGSMLGIRINFSMRCVIVPLIGKQYKLNSVVLPYLAFLEVYKFQLINLMIKMEKISDNEAKRRWNEATQKFDRKIYLLMKHMIKNTVGGLHVLINRPPTINHGSTLCMQVVDIKEDYNDLTMGVPIGILALIAGD